MDIYVIYMLGCSQKGRRMKGPRNMKSKGPMEKVKWAEEKVKWAEEFSQKGRALSQKGRTQKCIM